MKGEEGGGRRKKKGHFGLLLTQKGKEMFGEGPAIHFGRFKGPKG